MAKRRTHSLPETVEIQDFPEMVFIKAPPLGRIWNIAASPPFILDKSLALLAPPWNADRN